MTKYGAQPAKLMLREANLSVQATANQFGLTYGQVRAPIEGYCRPSETLKTGLSKLLGVTVEDLFTPEALDFPHNPRMNPWKPVQR